ncbi:PP2C family protein-serine/threonine phosphatase [Streptomyces sp. HB132]|uniref:PP2C family protein-serine/threonine phosphatase n=1 Tax=Streptomyces sp. HB132 TaxID=767388 RepID=UPI00195F664D|nr:PP2C family protein-serine/threonine phosphatase [Streptomyces sp. HB132]MBM7440388.1 serine phosphatase RsbU (regulator of sigma subunit) [Streptomyces sp. HB132]
MDRYAAVERELRKAAPHLLLDVIAVALREHYAVQSVELRLADYGMTTLQVVSEAPLAEPVHVHGSPQGRAFGAQQPYVEPRTARSGPGPQNTHLPVTVRGDRLGVLTVTGAEDGFSPADLAEMQQICEALGHEILVAERDTDLYLLARRATRLTLAAEMQWQLLPGRSVSRPEFRLGAHLEPAYAIFGDNFDWSVSAHHLTLTVTNGMGTGMEAALLTNLVVSALRNARRAGLDLAGQASLADQAVYAQHRGALHAAVLLLRFDLATGEVEAVDAGSPRMWRLRGRNVESVDFDAQLPLGMFEETEYVTERLRVEPGDRLLIGSDGVYDSASAAGERYGERAIARSLSAHRFLPSEQVPLAVLRDLRDHRGATPLDDDALVVCLDWFGRQSSTGDTSV